MTLELDLARRLADAKNRKDSINKELKEVNEEIKQAEKALVEELVENGKTSTGKIEGVGSFSLSRSIFPFVKAERMPGFLDYVRGVGDGYMIKEVIAAPALKKYLKDEIEKTVEHFTNHHDMDFDRIWKGTFEAMYPPDVLEPLLEERGDEIANMSMVELAKLYWSMLGVTSHEEMKLKHTGRNK